MQNNKDMTKSEYKMHHVMPVMPDGTEYQFNRYAKIFEVISTGERHLLKGQGATIYRNKPKIGRNTMCPCGSDIKYKKCCGVK
jgi:uncharacterized protein YecA (UPF0149 family)